MKTRYRILLILLISVVSFGAGSWMSHYGMSHKTAAERKILYYVDPMNPALKSDKPGIAPCGMALEPVYADQGGPGDGVGSPASTLPGMIRISPEKQQLLGVKVAIVEKKPWTHSIRALGRVTPDETRIYRINAALSGWIKEVLPVTTGSLVKKNDLLAKLYSLDYRTALATYGSLMRLDKSSAPTGDKAESGVNVTLLKQLRGTLRGAGKSAENAQIDYYRRTLLNYGISDYQLDEIARTGDYATEDIDIRAPIAGFILSRNISPGLRFDRGAEFFRIADLSQVWILVDVFENEASYFKPGMRVKMELPYQKKTLYARVSPVLPQFDAATRTLKVRLVADNPGYIMRPDMFVDVEIPMSGPASITVPMEAVVDSGLKKTVFVSRENGYFEPRPVVTGRSLGDRVEITQGLMPGEKIVVSGNFLIDSEARMQQASAGINGKAGRDPVCGMNIDEDRSGASGFMKIYQGKTYFFCSPECRDEFVKAPERYTSSTAEKMNMPYSKAKTKAEVDHTSHGTMKKMASDGMKGGTHDHEGMKSIMPKDRGPSSSMPGPGMTGMSGSATMPGQMPGGMPPPLSGKPAPTVPGPEKAMPMPMPGTQSPTSMPAQTPGSMLSPPSGKSAPMTPGPGTGASMPGSPGSAVLSEPKNEEPGRSMNRPVRRRGARPSEGAVIPGRAPGPAAPPLPGSGIIGPGGVPAKSPTEIKAIGGGQNP
ncbi:MAG: efflux RND transporter periplasmic adaptor subunit [Syntrophales bacterium]|nr:efflux RND transporter periplasmic adaptor subunit [Syntrophales bacterium]